MKTLNDYLDDESMRVPISFRVSVKKKHELMLCAEKYGSNLTNVLEVLTEDPDLKFKHNTSDILLENRRKDVRLVKHNQDLDYANKLIAELSEKLNESNRLLQVKSRKILDLVTDNQRLKVKLSETKSSTSS